MAPVHTQYLMGKVEAYSRCRIELKMPSEVESRKLRKGLVPEEGTCGFGGLFMQNIPGKSKIVCREVPAEGLLPVPQPVLT